MDDTLTTLQSVTISSVRVHGFVTLVAWEARREELLEDRISVMSAAEISVTREEWEEIKVTLLEANAEIQRLQKRQWPMWSFGDGSVEIERPEKLQSPRWSFWDGFFTGAGTTIFLVVFLLSLSKP